MKKILPNLIKACKAYNLIENNDKICIGLSGGKDSLALLVALKKLQNKLPIKFEIIACTIDLSNGQQNWSKITQFCQENGVEHHIVKTDIFNVVFDIRQEKNPCSLCSKMRKGSLYNKAKELGCNKVALAHHADDLIETLFMSMLFEGRLSTFQPKAYLSRTDLTLIRPFCLVFEKDISDFASNLPVLKNPCPMDKTSKRAIIKAEVNKFAECAPFGKQRLLSAIIEKNRYNLFN